MKLADVPLGVSAANERSPFRQPRRKRVARKAVKVARQEFYLALIRAGESKARAVIRGEVSANTVEKWQQDPKFAQRCREATEMAKAAAEGRLEGLLPRAVGVAEETLEDEDTRLRWDAAHKILRGRGVLRDADVVPVVGVNVVFIIGRGYRDMPQLIEGKSGNNGKV